MISYLAIDDHSDIRLCGNIWVVYGAVSVVSDVSRFIPELIDEQGYTEITVEFLIQGFEAIGSGLPTTRV